LAGVPGSLFGCSDAGDAGWLRIILQTGVSGCSTQYFLASAVRLSISSRFAKDVGVGVCLTNSQSSGLSLQILSRISCMRSAMGLATGVGFGNWKCFYRPITYLTKFRVGVIFAILTLQFLCSNWESTLVNGIGLASFWIFCANFVSGSLHGSCRRVGSRC